ncbi:MAG: Uma2 family endonuclease [Actinomycetota bacterium]
MGEAIENLSFADYLAAEEKSPERCEFVGGRMYLHAGGTARHNLMTLLLTETLGPGARASGCRLFANDRRLHTPAGNTYYPDVFVACGPEGDKQFETTASLIIEVAGPASLDRREKLTARPPGLARYLVVEPDLRRIEAFDPQTGSWKVYVPGNVLLTQYGSIDVEALYDELDRRATP